MTTPSHAHVLAFPTGRVRVHALTRLVNASHALSSPPHLKFVTTLVECKCGMGNGVYGESEREREKEREVDDVDFRWWVQVCVTEKARCVRNN